MPIPSAAFAAIGSAAGNASSGLIGSILQKKNQKELMKLQQYYNKQAFDWENARQDYLLANAYSINKSALKRAGYSTADPNGTGMTAPSINDMDSGGSPTAPLPNLALGDFTKSALAAAQIHNIEASTKKIESETEGQDIQNWLNSKYGEQQIQAALSNLNEDTKKKISETLYNDQQRLNSIQLTDSQVRNIEERLDMDWQKLPLQLQSLAADAYEARESGNLKHAQISEVWQSIKESQKRIQKLQSEIGLNDAQIGVLLCQAENIAQSTKNLGQDFKIKGNEIVETANRAELQQFQTDVQKSMGLTFYQAKNVAETILPIGMFGAAANMALGRGSAASVTP